MYTSAYSLKLNINYNIILFIIYLKSQGLYYDGHSGTYYRYDDETRSYKFHSQTQLPSTDETTNDGKKMKKDKKRHGKITDKV